ncbi:MAG: hypothetical protein IJU14_00435 [Clostridia bacterium]|nr:hypothetical protein [Clostridia bacterium]
MIMKRTIYFLSATVITVVAMSLFLTGCGENGKIRDGENGTITDNTKITTEITTERMTDNSVNGTTEIMTETETTVIRDDDITDNDMMDNNINDNDRNDNNNGVAGEIGDAIDDGISNIRDTLDGDDATEIVTETVTEIQ